MRVAARIAVMAAVATALLGCEGAPNRPAVYQGESRGRVRLTLVVPPSEPQGSGSAALTIRFNDASEPFRQRALRARPLDAFCMWRLGNGDGMSTVPVKLGAPQHTTVASIGLSDSSSPRRYTCGIHAHTDSIGESWPWKGYTRSAIVAAHLTPSQ